MAQQTGVLAIADTDPCLPEEKLLELEQKVRLLDPAARALVEELLRVPKAQQEILQERLTSGSEERTWSTIREIASQRGPGSIPRRCAVGASNDSERCARITGLVLLAEVQGMQAGGMGDHKDRERPNASRACARAWVARAAKWKKEVGTLFVPNLRDSARMGRACSIGCSNMSAGC